jgi:transposase InsO family protein
VLTEKIRRSHQQSGEVYGSPKVHKDLVAEGETCSVNRVARLMKAADIKSKIARKFVVTTDSKNTMEPAPDLLKRRFTVDKQNETWVSDTTFIGTREGWLYLAVILDLFSRQVIGWSMGTRNNTELVQDALTMAIWRRGKVNDVIVHSDQGSTYASGGYQNQLRDNQLRCSMSRKGECLDNAVAESFFGSLKNERVYHEDYRTRTEARQSIFEYIEVFYNRQRRHAFLNYMTPVEYEEKYASI